jgi:phosphoglycolate phosphatase-like HAD superfamily hydrolase
VIAARKNHIDSIGVTYGDGDTDKLVNQKPAYIFNNISEAVSLFL